MAHYLDTGQPSLYDSFGWADQRQQALTLSGQLRNQYIQQEADAVIKLCDTNNALQRATAPRTSGDAQATLEAKERSQCSSIDGTSWRWGVCYIGYVSPNDGQVYYYPISFDANANVVPGPGPQNADECAASGETVTTQWHPDTDVCSR